MMATERGHLQEQRQRQDQQSRVFSELSALVLSILRSPPSTIQFSDQTSVAPSMRRRRSSAGEPQITPAGFASLLLGVSFALMLCGSVTFFIGFFLMPWVLAMVMVFYVAGIVSTISMLCRSLLCYALPPPPSSPRKEVPAWKLLWRVCSESATMSKTFEQLLCYTTICCYQRKTRESENARRPAASIDAGIVDKPVFTAVGYQLKWPNLFSRNRDCSTMQSIPTWERNL